MVPEAERVTIEFARVDNKNVEQVQRARGGYIQGALSRHLQLEMLRRCLFSAVKRLFCWRLLKITHTAALLSDRNVTV